MPALPRSAVLELAPVILWSRFQEQIPMLPMGRATVPVVNLWDEQNGQDAQPAPPIPRYPLPMSGFAGAGYDGKS